MQILLDTFPNSQLTGFCNVNQVAQFVDKKVDTIGLKFCICQWVLRRIVLRRIVLQKILNSVSDFWQSNAISSPKSIKNV